LKQKCKFPIGEELLVVKSVLLQLLLLLPTSCNAFSIYISDLLAR
jgi:hypothetical protein